MKMAEPVSEWFKELFTPRLFAKHEVINNIGYIKFSMADESTRFGPVLALAINELSELWEYCVTTDSMPTSECLALQWVGVKAMPKRNLIDYIHKYLTTSGRGILDLPTYRLISPNTILIPVCCIPNEVQV